LFTNKLKQFANYTYYQNVVMKLVTTYKAFYGQNILYQATLTNDYITTI